MGKNHFNGQCPNIPEAAASELARAERKKSHLQGGGGRIYWAEKAAAVGVAETEDGLVFE
jgi:hypothetical protein